MKKSNDLKQVRASKLQAQSDLVGVAKADQNRNLTAEENVKFDDFQAEIERLDKEILRAEQFEANEARMSASNGVVVGKPIIATKKQERFSISQMIRNASEGTAQRAIESSLIEKANEELRANGKEAVSGKRIALPADMLFRAQSVTGDSGVNGGALVETTKQIVMPLLSNLTLEGLGAKVYSGLVGDVDLISGESFAFDYATENGTATDKTAGFDGPTLSPKRLTGVVKISNRLLAQTSPQAEANIYALIGQGINAAMVKAAISGSTNGPTGLYDSAGNVQAGTAGTPTWDDVVGLETLIKSSNATKDNLYYLSDPALMGKLKTTKKDAGSGIYLVGENGMLNGKKYLDTTLAGTLDAGASHPLIYGDFSQMAIGFWSGVQMTVDPYTLAAEGYTRVIFNIYNDVQLANPKAFAIRKNFTV
jgi:HK97 family phage major capsid protein